MDLELQSLVDKNTANGMPREALRALLAKDHGLAPTALMPLPSLRAADQGRELTGEASALASVKLFKQFRDSPGASISLATLFSSLYVAAGPTYLDRLIQGLGRLAMECGSRRTTKFDAAVDAMRHRTNHEASALSAAATFTQLIGHGAGPMMCVDRAISPWLLSQKPTENLQIDADLAEVFLATKPPKGDFWIDDLCAVPFYLDVRQRQLGERVLSAIFCAPNEDGTNFTCTAVVEWAGRGVESFLFYTRSTDTLTILPLAEQPVSGDACVPLYQPLMEKALHLVSVARQYLETMSPTQRADSTVRRLANPSAASPLSEKKLKAQEKTHSYFRIVRIETPVDRFGQTPIHRNSWALDHLVSVTGHFRWQPYGPGLTQQKLIWIEAYDKGAGGRHRPESNPELLVGVGGPPHSDHEARDESHERQRP